MLLLEDVKPWDGLIPSQISISLSKKNCPDKYFLTCGNTFSCEIV